MCCTQLAEIQYTKIAKNSPSGHHRTTLSGYVLATKAHIDNRKKLFKWQYLPHMSPQYGELRPTVGEFVALQQISTGFAPWLRYCSYLAQWKPTKLCTMLAVSCTDILYIHFGGLAP